MGVVLSVCQPFGWNMSTASVASFNLFLSISFCFALQAPLALHYGIRLFHRGFKPTYRALLLQPRLCPHLGIAGTDDCNHCHDTRSALFSRRWHRHDGPVETLALLRVRRPETQDQVSRAAECTLPTNHRHYASTDAEERPGGHADAAKHDVLLPAACCVGAT